MSFAISASLLWGLSYAISSILVHTYSPAFLVLIQALVAIPIMIAILIFSPMAEQDLSSVIEGKHIWLLVIELLIGIAANLLIIYSLKSPSPVAAAIIETSYPFFMLVALWMFFGRTQIVDVSLILGGGMIMMGVVILVMGQKH